jgi:hypothetical protein
MVRRWLGVVAIGASALIATSCLPPPPPGWVPPIITAVVSPDPVVAGQPFTIEVTATANTTVRSIDIELRRPVGAPSSSSPYPGAGCVPGDLVPDLSVTQTFTCTLPPLVPNGEWRLQAFAANDGSSIYRGSASFVFQVTGGSDDLAAPALESVEISPNPVVIGEPFSVTMRAVDDHHAPPAPTTLGANIVIPAPPGATVSWTCSPVTPTPISDTVLEWHFTDCLIPAGSSPWTYAGGIQVIDQLGYSARLSFSFAAVAG